MRKAFVAVACLVLSGCLDASVIDGNPNGVWLKQPFIGSGNADTVAARYCAQYGKRADYESTIYPAPTHDYFLPILVYGCK